MTVLLRGEPASVLGPNQVLDPLPLYFTADCSTIPVESQDFCINEPEVYRDIEIEPEAPMESASLSIKTYYQNPGISIRYSSSPADLQYRFIADLIAKQENPRRIYKYYSHRIEILCNDAEIDGFALNEVSQKDFWQYIRSVPFAQKASLVLMDNGNLRAVWKGDDESHLGIQFLGNQWVEYVIFKRRPSTSDVARVAGRDTLDG